MIKKKNIILFLIIVSVHIFILFGLKFTAWPEMFSYPYLRNNGFLIYKDMIHPYPPLLTMALSSIYKLFGYNLLTLRIFTYLMILMNDFLIFFLARKVIKDDRYLFIPLIFYVMTQPFLDGNMLWFDFAASTPILFALFFFYEVFKEKNIKKNLLFLGIFLSIAALIKQTFTIFFLLTIVFLLLRKTKLKDLYTLFVGPFVMLSLFLIRLAQEKAFLDFLNWNLVYPSRCWTQFPGYVQMTISREDMLTILILCLPFLSLPFFRRKGKAKLNFFVVGVVFFICSLITVYPRFSFFHFQPALAILAVLFVSMVARSPKKVFTLTLFLLILFSYRNIYPKIKSDWGKETRFLGFEEKAISQIIKNSSEEEEKVFFLGLDSSLYALSERIPPKRWFDNFGWYLEIDEVQEEILERWKKDLPQIIFWKKPSQGEWYELGVYQPEKITDFILANYNRETEVYPGIYSWRIKD